jgi:hypothetical protein
MHRFRHGKTLLIIWARILITLAAYSVCFNSSAGYVMGLADRSDPNLADVINTLAALISPGFYWLIGGTVLIGPVILVAGCHYGWTWLLRRMWFHWPMPQIWNSVWEGFLAAMVFWAGLAISLLIFVPLAAQSPDQEVAQEFLDAVSGIALLLILVVWHLLFWLEIRVRQLSITLAQATHQPSDHASGVNDVPETLDPIEQDLRRLKTTMSARDRQRAIAAINQQQPTRSRKSQMPFDDPKF